ncbi:hypothetical protein [Cupriavidus pinatubonensis]|uniref:Uncharacterized protein n=1 Tax=Cupriavidus pinatubonensis TaxID=248026 RepID=A0ABM8W9H0_9BURK|nr:hypothetical protein [Cupriavidus pinatubonensis]CAG9163846.1 hypothetical protein LMG23994_00303 [Cupriavidus pinatubonensis]
MALPTNSQQSLDLFETDATPANGVSMPMNPRKRRALVALMHGPLAREDFDRTVGCSNGPDLILALRRIGFHIPCELKSHRDRDGRDVRFGVYELSACDRAIVARWLSAKEG